MRYRSTVIYIAAAVLLAGAYCYDLSQEKAKQEARDVARTLSAIPSSPLKSIIVERPDMTIRLERNSGDSDQGWGIKRPIRYPADDIAVEKLRKNIKELKYSRTITENADNLSDFGLDSPSLVIAYTSSQGSGSVCFGDQDPTGYGYYVFCKGNEKRVYLVKGESRRTVDKDLFDLRSKKLFSLPRNKVELFAIDRSSGKWMFKKNQGEWFMEGYPDFDVDSRKLEALIGRFANAQVVSVEKEKVENTEGYGFKRPAAVITLASAEKCERVFFGDPCKSESGIYAMVEGIPQLFTVNKWLLEEIPDTKSGIQAGPEKNDN